MLEIKILNFYFGRLVIKFFVCFGDLGDGNVNTTPASGSNVYNLASVLITF